MLPPIDGNVLKANPRFEKLYNTITTSILNPDASTKLDPSTKQHDAVRQELKAYRLKAARVHLLRTAISTAAAAQTPPPSKQAEEKEQQPQLKQPKQYQTRRSKSRPQSQSQPQAQPQAQAQQTPTLPPDLIELLFLIPAFLNNASTLPPASVSLLLTSPPFTSLPTLFPDLVALISARLTAQAKTLARVLSPSTNASYIHRAIPSLPSLASTLVSDLATSKTALSRARLAATASLTRLLAQHTEALTLLIRALETKHDLVAASTELRAAAAHQDAQAWALAAEALLWETRRQAYPPEARAALLHYRQHLRDAGRRLEDATHVRENELADYGVDVARRDSVVGPSAAAGRPRRRTTASVDENKERTMREIARVWREMETRLREIEGDLSRLR
ncbi:hypothetical protein ANO14919_117360 [Xylariales sp. No.14919]|nr:hypothetical protein F5X98DRAFT_382771 [Xylaria grammica]GAW22201.1 hypothetical protein ANO14919_117360 [Xylariales sp. No.14919]